MSVCIELKVALRCKMEATFSRGSGTFKFAAAVNEVVIEVWEESGFEAGWITEAKRILLDTGILNLEAELISQVTARTLVADLFQETRNFVSYHM